MTMSGSDPDRLDDAAADLRRSADELDGHVATLQVSLRSVAWVGGVASDFRESWEARGRRRVLACSSQMRERASALATQADEQRTASRGGTGSGHQPQVAAIVTTQVDRIRDIATSFADWLEGGSTAHVPVPLPPPPADPGAGEHGSQPWYSKGDDLAFEGVAATAATAADALGYTNAARHLRHYLDNSGDVLTVDPTEIARDAPGFRRSVDLQLTREIDAATEAAIASGDFGAEIEFRSDWTGYYIGPDESADWFYALGGVSHSVTGVIVVNDGAPPSVDVRYQYHLHDQYNWDTGKETSIGPVTISDEQMGELHTAGFAQEYRVGGSSPVLSADGSVGSPAPTEVLPVDDERDGTRADPTRPGQTEGRVEGDRVR